ncbi:MAG TPA: sulfotransferase [Fimbriimonas sp.]|nr:sulfotransferase [Fimbriimonas sp.]
MPSAARRLTIKEIARPYPISIVARTDFVAEDAGEIEPSEILRDPKFTLYCIDLENESVLFVENEDPIAVEAAPFYYQGQAETAVGLAAMPLDAFYRIAEEIPEPANGIIFVHSVGRCGSTLLSKALQAAPEVQSLSEPDDLSQMVGYRRKQMVTDELLQKMIAASIRWRCKPRLGTSSKWVAVKPRSEVLNLGDLIGLQFPHARHLFLYRDGIAWMHSIVKGWRHDWDLFDEESNREVEARWSGTLGIIHDYIRPDKALNPVEVRILSWISSMEAYLQLVETGIPIIAARYEDLNAQPISILKQLFQFCGIRDVDWDVMSEVLSRDSQAGTTFDREQRKRSPRELTPELADYARNMIATRPLLRTPDVIMPNTITP